MTVERTPINACWLRLTNGWTVSISADDTPPALCSVAAWPTALDGVRFGEDEYFDFGRDQIDRRCWTIGDVREALNLVASAPTPTAEGAAQ